MSSRDMAVAVDPTLALQVLHLPKEFLLGVDDHRRVSRVLQVGRQPSTYADHLVRFALQKSARIGTQTVGS